MTDFARLYLVDTRERFAQLRRTAERAMAQIDDRAFFAAPDPATNSVAVTVKHVGGNLRSRFTDFLTSDGEKPDRDRDAEFVIGAEDMRERLLALWERGWTALEGALAALAPEDLARGITIRGEPHTVVGALQRSLAHVAYHVGQIVLLAKHWAGPAWTTLTIPRGASSAFNAQLRASGTDAAPGSAPGSAPGAPPSR
jgi:hypothetical protein